MHVMMVVTPIRRARAGARVQRRRQEGSSVENSRRRGGRGGEGAAPLREVALLLLLLLRLRVVALLEVWCANVVVCVGRGGSRSWRGRSGRGRGNRSVSSQQAVRRRRRGTCPSRLVDSTRGNTATGRDQASRINSGISRRWLLLLLMRLRYLLLLLVFPSCCSNCARDRVCYGSGKRERRLRVCDLLGFCGGCCWDDVAAGAGEGAGVTEAEAEMAAEG